MSDPTETVRRCDRCRIDSAADPCDSCPLRGAFVERGGRPADYARWTAAGGWRVRWTLNRLAVRRERRMTALALMTGYPRVRPSIVAHHLEER